MAKQQRSESVLNTGFGGDGTPNGPAANLDYEFTNELTGIRAGDGNVAYGNTGGTTGYRIGRKNQQEADLNR